MNTLPITADMTLAVVKELKQSSLFGDLSDKDLLRIARSAAMLQFDNGETVVSEGDASDSFFVVVSGEAVIKVRHDTSNEPVEIARVQPFDTVGELGLLLSQPRSATVVAGADTIMLRFDQKFFAEMFRELPDFALVACKVMAKRLQQSSRHVVPCRAGTTAVDGAAQKLLPLDFVQRHRVLPLKVEGNVLSVGFVEDPTPQVMNLLREMLPGMEIRTTAIDVRTFDTTLKSLAGPVDVKPAPEAAPPVESKSPNLDRFLRRMVAERASDLHLTSRMKPRWRIDGSIYEISDAPVLSSKDLVELITPITPERNKAQFAEDNDTDFAYAIPDVARFRVNLFCDNRGPGAVFRQIPAKILTMEQLGIPLAVRKLCDYPKGLILVTGPTGSGKSTTLAAMIDHINRTREDHIITLEDPIEFVHVSQKCLVNQREVGPHTKSFSRALRAALREDPDIVLVGEMRDLETVQLALEVANTGHLVFGTLHTNTATSTISRVIDMFPAGQQNQIRSVLADVLKGVVAQTLCKRIGGGRIAALEVLVTDTGVANLIRENKCQQLMNAMETGRARGNRILNEELAKLVKEKTVDQSEAFSKAVDKVDLASKLGLKEFKES
jgi:twitching motility protein PilT